MHTRRLLPLRVARCVVAASLTLASVAAGTAEAPPVVAPTQATASERAPDAAERAAMLAILKAESAPERAAWFSYNSGAADGKSLANALAAVFREGGWKVQVSALSGMVLKPGVSLLLAEEQPPSWTDSALRATQASGIDVKSASGYRAYYDEKKAKDPAWPGVPLAKDAAFVIVVGPAPKG